MENNAHTSESREIYIRLEQYDDIFSDFDIRPYAHRALSVDFLDELKRAVSGMDEEEVDLILYVSEKNRQPSHEGTILERLAAHFKRHLGLVKKEKNRVLKTGISMVALGVLSMIAATFIIFEDPTKNLLLSFLVVFLEPAAWFLLWEGMDQIIFTSKNIHPELSFYQKMVRAKERMSFKSY